MSEMLFLQVIFFSPGENFIDFSKLLSSCFYCPSYFVLYLLKIVEEAS
jgi:hypothetical protein